MLVMSWETPERLSCLDMKSAQPIQILPFEGQFELRKHISDIVSETLDFICDLSLQCYVIRQYCTYNVSLILSWVYIHSETECPMFLFHSIFFWLPPRRLIHFHEPSHTHTYKHKNQVSNQAPIFCSPCTIDIH